MATLILTDFQCVDETNEIGSDSPYFVFFIGKGGDAGAAKLVTVRGPGWDERVDQGDILHPKMAVDEVDRDTLVLCALMEEDLGTDVTTGTGAFRKVRDHMRTLLSTVAASGSFSVEQLAESLMPELRREILSHRINDDLIDVIHVPTDIDPRAHGSFSMQDSGAHYLVWFAIE
jgi:hypothetical protein